MEKADITAISEHKLYEPELGLLREINTGWTAFGKSSEDFNPIQVWLHPGVLWDGYPMEKESVSHDQTTTKARN